MTKKAPAEPSTFELASQYEQAGLVLASTETTNDYRKGNRQHDKLVKLGRALRQKDAEGRAALLRLMSNESNWVRLYAACEVLRFAPREAEVALEQLASGPRGSCRFTAEVTLQEWRNGTLKLQD